MRNQYSKPGQPDRAPRTCINKETLYSQDIEKIAREIGDKFGDGELGKEALRICREIVEIIIGKWDQDDYWRWVAAGYKHDGRNWTWERAADRTFVSVPNPCCWLPDILQFDGINKKLPKDYSDTGISFHDKDKKPKRVKVKDIKTGTLSHYWWQLVDRLQQLPMKFRRSTVDAIHDFLDVASRQKADLLKVTVIRPRWTKNRHREILTKAYGIEKYQGVLPEWSETGNMVIDWDTWYVQKIGKVADDAFVDEAVKIFLVKAMGEMGGSFRKGIEKIEPDEERLAARREDVKKRRDYLLKAKAEKELNEQFDFAKLVTDEKVGQFDENACKFAMLKLGGTFRDDVDKITSDEERLAARREDLKQRREAVELIEATRGQEIKARQLKTGVVMNRNHSWLEARMSEIGGTFRDDLDSIEKPKERIEAIREDVLARRNELVPEMGLADQVWNAKKLTNEVVNNLDESDCVFKMKRLGGEFSANIEKIESDEKRLATYRAELVTRRNELVPEMKSDDDPVTPTDPEEAEQTESKGDTEGEGDSIEVSAMEANEKSDFDPKATLPYKDGEQTKDVEDARDMDTGEVPTDDPALAQAANG